MVNSLSCNCKCTPIPWVKRAVAGNANPEVGRVTVSSQQRIQLRSTIRSSLGVSGWLGLACSVLKLPNEFVKLTDRTDRSLFWVWFLAYILGSWLDTMI